MLVKQSTVGEAISLLQSKVLPVLMCKRFNSFDTG